MIITICLLILIYSILKRPVTYLVNKLEGVDWKTLARNTWETVVRYSKKGGRTAARPVLKFYYAMAEGDLTTFQKALVYAGIIYIAVPGDVLPRKVLKWVGVLDDVAVAAWIYNKIKDAITPSIEHKVEDTLIRWFGPEIVTGAEPIAENL